MRQSKKIARYLVGALIVSLLLLFTTPVMAGSSSITESGGTPAPQGISLVSSPVSTTTTTPLAPEAVASGAQAQRPHHQRRPRHKHPKAHVSVFERLRRHIPSWFRTGLNRLGQCENSGSYRTVKHNGFFGRYQFDLETWSSPSSLGYHNNPEHASPAQQDWAAWRLYRQRGTQPWPECGWRLLRA